MKEAYFTIYQNGEHQIEIKKSKVLKKGDVSLIPFKNIEKAMRG